ncbi:ATP phosphoribosyltransferase regulatory subunit [Paracoccus sp. Z118]|uniref:ATP phosphoribosyltransferase regulatory subunit n=1 Tax=Paracoccus sp. Z118 TaxID=2851017 RepID=UPI001C2C5E31|nr:ATP phosphoribosyltransferase regulatory subunit [Paracoccus sp. Z118]MBV0890530.1 ATP phosphoribosyltransferase regulatory subunit [Paracoccus sp. Z118]
MIPRTAKAAVGRRILDAFLAAGAVEVAPDILLPADTLLDLYGEDIRARAYLSTDPIRGEVVLRPDFTVPVVQMHMAQGAEPARYCYLGEVFRKQDHGDTRPANPRDNEYLQAGFEMFSRDAGADAEVFALFHGILAPQRLTATIGDMDLILDAVRGLPLSQARCAMLSHHIWRPARFERLLDRFSAPAKPRVFAVNGAPWTGLRSEAEMAARIERLETARAEPVLPPEWRERLARLFAVAGPAPEALDELRVLSDHMPAIAEATERLAARLDAIAARGIDPGTILFDASHGRRTMEYYDGFTFSFTAPGREGWPPVASGGRYDALTKVLGQGEAIPAVGGIIRPGLLTELERC